MEAEYNRFRRPVHWYLDAAQVPDAAHTVFEQWTNWLRANEKMLAQLHVLTGTDTAHMTISIARHLSDASKRMFLYSDRSEWTRALLRSAPGLTAAPESAPRFDEPAISIGAVRENRDVTTLTAPSCAFTFRTIAADVIFCRFEGNDSGDLTDCALDRPAALAPRSTGRAHCGSRRVASLDRVDWRSSQPIRANQRAILRSAFSAGPHDRQVHLGNGKCFRGTPRDRAVPQGARHAHFSRGSAVGL